MTAPVTIADANDMVRKIVPIVKMATARIMRPLIFSFLGSALPVKYRYTQAEQNKTKNNTITPRMIWINIFISFSIGFHGLGNPGLELRISITNLDFREFLALIKESELILVIIKEYGKALGILRQSGNIENLPTIDE